MESQKLGNVIELEGISGSRYRFWVLSFKHDFKRNKTNKGTPALFVITKCKIQDSTRTHDILQYGKIIDLSKFSLQKKPKTALLKKGATHICVLKGKEPDEINAAEKDLIFTLGGLMLE